MVADPCHHGVSAIAWWWAPNKWIERTRYPTYLWVCLRKSFWKNYISVNLKYILPHKSFSSRCYPFPVSHFILASPSLYAHHNLAYSGHGPFLRPAVLFCSRLRVMLPFPKDHHCLSPCLSNPMQKSQGGLLPLEIWTLTWMPNLA